MSIYLLTRIGPVGYDEQAGIVVRANSDAQAREMANDKAGDEGHVWGDPNQVHCEVITPDGPAQTILESYRAG